MVKPSCKIKAEECEVSCMDSADPQTAERKRILKLVSNFKGSDIVKPQHIKRSSRLATKARAPRAAPLAMDVPEIDDDLEAALISTEELESCSLFDTALDDCWFPQANTTLPDIDDISAELDLDDLSCSSDASDCTIPDSSSHASTFDEILDEQEVRKISQAHFEVPPEMPGLIPASSVAPGPAPKPLNLAKTAAAGPATRMPYQFTGVTLSMGGRKPLAYTRKPLAVHGGLRIRAHLGFAANLAAVCASL